MYKEVFMYPTIVAFILIVYHCYITYGKRTTINYFGVCLIWVFIREFFYQNYFNIYTFYGITLKILNVPITIPMGWLFASYISLHFAQNFTGIYLPKSNPNIKTTIPQKYFEQKYFQLIVIACIIQSGICFCIESTAMTMAWWDMNYFNYDLAPLTLPLIGWSFTILITNTLFFLVNYPQFRTKKNIIFLLNCIIALFYGNFLFNVFLDSIENYVIEFILGAIYLLLFLALFLYYWDFTLFYVVAVFIGGFLYKLTMIDQIFTGSSLFMKQIYLSIIGFGAMFLILIYFLNSKNRTWPKNNRWLLLPIIIVVIYLNYFY